LRKALLGGLILVLLCVAAGAAFNTICVWYLQRKYPPQGNFYEVNGSSMHMYCAGSGSPTVVLEAGLGDDWLYWQKVQPEIAKLTRVCSYDRAGLGWSDMQPGLRDAKNIASQLRTLLKVAGENGPIVLLAGSAGGFYVRRFFADYPENVVGFVFVDASLPEQIEELPGAKDTEAARSKRHRDAEIEWLKEASGWARVTGNCKGEVEEGLEAYLPMARAEACRPSYATSWLGEWDEFWHSGEEAAAAKCCGELPLLVISQDPDRAKQGWSAAMIAAQPIWNSLQERLKRLSPHSRRIIARGSGHHVMTDRPDVIIDGVKEFIEHIRDKTTDAAEGTTIVR